MTTIFEIIGAVVLLYVLFDGGRVVRHSLRRKDK